MQKNISERSREFSSAALQNLEWILQKYPARPFAKNLTEAERAALLQKMQEFGNAVAATHYKKFSFYSDAKNIRNEIAHSVKYDEEKIQNCLDAFFDFADSARTELVSNIERAYSQNEKIRRFEKSGSAFKTEKFRKRFVDHLQSEFFKDENSFSFEIEGEGETEKNILNAAKSFLNPADFEKKSLLDFAKNEGEINEQILEEIVSWTEGVHSDLQKENPFSAEEAFAKNFGENFSNEKFDFSKIKEKYFALESVKNFPSNVDFDFYEKKFLECEKFLKEKNKKGVAKKSEQEKSYEEQTSKEQKILFRNLHSDIQNELLRRKISWELSQIENSRKNFLKTLYEKIEKFKKLFETLNFFCKDFGRLWDFAKSEFKNSDFEILEKYAFLLSNDQGLQALSKMIGRHREEEKKFQKELRKKIAIDTLYKPVPAFKGEIAGLKLSGNISDALPSELALYVNKKTRPIFKMKFAQKKLLSYAYTKNYEYQKSHEENEEVEVGKTAEEKGPVIICVDTSGSMDGAPERVAKTVAFALAQKSLDEKRECFLISFSTRIKKMDLTSFDSVDGLKNLVKFLKMSFDGGTDAAPALKYSLQLCENEKWKAADILMISDFVMDDLPAELEAKIKQQQKNKTRFFSLAITSSGNQNVISAFDKNWTYDDAARDAGAALVRQICEGEQL